MIRVIFWLFLVKDGGNKRRMREVEFLAAVVMIQRNFRARKARREV